MNFGEANRGTIEPDFDKTVANFIEAYHPSLRAHVTRCVLHSMRARLQLEDRRQDLEAFGRYAHLPEPLTGANRRSRTWRHPAKTNPHP